MARIHGATPKTADLRELLRRTYVLVLDVEADGTEARDNPPVADVLPLERKRLTGAKSGVGQDADKSRIA